MKFWTSLPRRARTALTAAALCVLMTAGVGVAAIASQTTQTYTYTVPGTTIAIPAQTYTQTVAIPTVTETVTQTVTEPTSTGTTTTTPTTTSSSIPNALGPFGQKAPDWSVASNWRSDSATLLSQAQAAATNGSPLAVVAYGTAYYAASSTDPQTSVKNLNGWGNAPGTTTFRLPAGAKPSAGSDAHMAVVQPDGTTVEMWQAARQSDGTWTAGAVGIAQAGQFTYPYAVCKGSSLTLLDGAVSPLEVHAGAINHALEISLPQSVVSSSYVFPSNSSDGTVSGGVPEGSRLVLDPSYDISGLTGLQREIAQALKTYGAIVGDRSSADITVGAVAPESWTSLGQADPWAAQGLTGYPDTGIRALLPHMRIAA